MNQSHYRKICNCVITRDKYISRIKEDFTFCQKCGCIILKNEEGIIHYTLKPKKKQTSNEINPFTTIKYMKKNTEKNYPYFKKRYIINVEESNVNIYLKKRNDILIQLKKLVEIFDCNDMIFYQCLFFMDYIFIHQIKEDFSEKDIIYYLIGYFLCSIKIKDVSNNEPPLLLFTSIKTDFLLSVKQIVYYELICLKHINYNIFSYSAYDWLIHLIENGIVFDCEIDERNNIILINGHRYSVTTALNKFALKMLLNLTKENIFIKYSPLNIAFSIVQISREKILNYNLINTYLFNKLINLYGINFYEYKKCYEEIKLNKLDDIIEIEKEVKKDEEILGYQYKNKNNNSRNYNKNNKKRVAKQLSINNPRLSKIYNINKNFFLNNNSQKNIVPYRQKGNESEENNSEEKTNIFTTKKNFFDAKMKVEKKMLDRIKLNKFKKRKSQLLPVISKKKISESFDNFPNKILRIETKLEPIKEKPKFKVMKSSNELININYSLVTKLTNTKNNQINQNSSNISNKALKTNKIIKPIINIGQIKNNILKIKTNNHSKRKSLDTIKIFQFNKASNLLQYNNIINGFKRNNNDGLLEKSNEKIIFKLRRNYNYHLSVKNTNTSLPNKNGREDRRLRINSNL